MAATFKRAVT